MSDPQVESLSLSRGRATRITVLLLAVALLVLGYGLQGTLLGLRAGLEGMAEEVIGVVMSAFYVGFVAGSLYVPKLVEQVGHIRAFAALASIASATALAFAVFVSPPVWIGLRALQGGCYAGLLLVVESWLNTATGRETRGRILALYGFVLYGAWAASQPLLKLAPPSQVELFILVSICLSLALVPITLTRTGGPGNVTASRPSLRRLYDISPLALAGVFVTGISAGAFFGMAPRFAQMIGFSDSAVAAFISVHLLGAVLLQWPLGWLSDRIDRRLVIIVSALVAGIGAAGIAFNTGASQLLLLALSFLLGAFLLPIYSICVAQMNDAIRREEVVSVATGLIFIFGVGSAVGPFGASVAMGRTGPAGLFAFMSLLLLAYGVFAFVDAYGPGGTPRIREAAKKSFVALPLTLHPSTRMHRHGSGKSRSRRAPR